MMAHGVQCRGNTQTLSHGTLVATHLLHASRLRAASSAAAWLPRRGWKRDQRLTAASPGAIASGRLQLSGVVSLAPGKITGDA